MPVDFIARAVLAGFGIAIIAGPLGSIIVWRRMANFGDALAHSTLLGLCFALLLNLNLYMGITIICLAIACLLALISRQRQLANDTILCILAYTTLAGGFILISTLKGIRLDLLEYLYGDILAVASTDLLWIYSVDVVVGIILIKIWQQVLAITIHEDLAKVEGVPVKQVHWLLVIILSIVFAVTMKLVGILLITALLIIPASTARAIAKTPEQMALFASLIGALAVYLGLYISSHWDWPAGPAIVLVTATFFGISMIIPSLAKKAIDS